VLTGLGVPLAYSEYAAGHALDGAMIANFRGWLDKQLDAQGTAAGAA
jgi:phospholipase/carboxylesterase